jgi:hypothetical protein
MNNAVKDYPKISSPFVRKEINGKYLSTPEIQKGYDWVFSDEGVHAVDKLHGTNICLIFQDGILQSIDNRANRIIDKPCISANLKTNEARMIEGVINAFERKWIEKGFTGRLYGELVGPTLNCNIHNLTKHYFVPFEYLKAHCHWKTWIANKYPKTFESIRLWFKDLPSLFTQRMTKEFDLAEGLVFYHPDGQRKAKLRRDFFDYTGE